MNENYNKLNQKLGLYGSLIGVLAVFCPITFNGEYLNLMTVPIYGWLFLLFAGFSFCILFEQQYKSISLLGSVNLIITLIAMIKLNTLVTLNWGIGLLLISSGLLIATGLVKQKVLVNCEV